MATLPQLDTRCKHPEGSLLEAARATEARSSATSAMVAPRYRPDIDGLRGLAVVCVVLFHARVPGFAGGYVGVDVFFVISGYLITQLLARSAGEHPRRWLKEFYLRRGRRILPALLVTLAVTAAAATLYTLPWDLVEFGKSLAASSLFLGNVAAWRAGNYFNLGGQGPLTHLWSIAIEEQFYLVYPLTLLLFARFAPRRLLPAIVTLAAASLALCVWASGHKPLANFFLAPTRSWELLLGAAVALGERHWRISRVARECLAIPAGLALVLVVCLYDSELPYPGLATLVPSLATAILITTSREQATAVGRFLCTSPLVFTGLLSYSLYLWHLPILLLVPYYMLHGVDGWTMAGLLAAAYVVAVISWRFIEQPVRKGPVLRSDRRFVLTAAALSAVLLLFGILLWASHGLPHRFDTADVPDRWERSMGRCETLPPAEVASGLLCSYGSQAAGTPRAIVWGDSHARALVPAYRQLATAYGMRVYFAIHPSCRPLLGIDNRSHYPATRQHCADFNAAVTKAIGRIDPGLVILNAHWTDEDQDLVPTSGLARPPGISNFRLGLQQSLQAIDSRHRSVCLVLDVPAFKYDIPHALVRARLLGSSTDFLQLSRPEALRALAPERDLRAEAAEQSLTVVDPKDVLCSSGMCAFRSNGHVLYGDSNHLDTAGALLVMSTLEPCFQLRSQAGPQSARRE